MKRAGLIVRVFILIVFLLGGAVLCTAWGLKPELRSTLTPYAFVAAFLSGFMSANVLTNIAYVYFK